jgi:ADP-heptose:LPS heptosyltransferase/glycosyltransferase involved in cell wall biosynthesis
MDIICFGQQAWSRTWTEKQQHSTRLARRGHRVLYVDPGWSHDVRGAGDRLRALAPVRSGLGLREVRPGSLYVFTYPYAAALRWRVNRWRHPRTIREVARRLGFRSPAVLAFHPSAAPVIRVLDPSVLAYYAVDEYSAYGGMGASERAGTRAAEDEILRRSSVAFGVSPRLVRRFAGIQPRSRLLENGVDAEHFAADAGPIPAHPMLAALPGPRMGLVGQIDERVDQSLLVALARAYPSGSVVLVGRVREGVDVSRLRAEPNIHFVPFQSYTALPAVLRALDVCLVPYHGTELTHSCNPAKIFEYVAADRPVVSTPLEGIVACRGAITLAAGADAWVRAVSEALADPGALRAERRAVTAESHWERRTDELEAELMLAAAAAGRGTALQRARAVSGRGLARLPGPRARHNDYWRAAVGPALPPRLYALHLATRAAGRLYHAIRVAARVARGERPARIRRILVVRNGTFVGDLIVLLPLLDALRARFPHAHIALGVQSGLSVGPLLEGSRSVDEIRPLDALDTPGRARQLRGVFRLFAEGYDAVITGVGYFLSPEAMLSGAPYSVALYDGHPQQWLSSRALPLDVTRHEAENNLALVEILTGEPEDPRRVPRIEVDAAAAGAAAGQVLEQLGVPDGARILAVHAGSKKLSRRWPADRFARLVTRALEEDPTLHAVFTGTPGERDVVETVRAAIPDALRGRASSSVGFTDLHALIGLLDRSSALVSNDTGVMHLGRARGTPLLALLGPENDRRWGPHPHGPGPAVALRYEVPCARCARQECEALFCMLSLGVDEAYAELRALLDGAARKAGPAAETGGRVTDPGALAAPRSSALVRRVHRRGWRALAGAGFDIPVVSVVVAADAGREVAGGIEHQDYPNIEVIRVGSPAASGSEVTGEPGFGARPVRAVAVDGGAENAWRTVLNASRGEILILHPPAVRWPADRVSADVAALMREPDADVTVYADGPRPRRSGSAAESRLPLAAVRHAWLARQLQAEGVGAGVGAPGMAEWLAARLPDAVSVYADSSRVEMLHESDGVPAAPATDGQTHGLHS